MAEENEIAQAIHSLKRWLSISILLAAILVRGASGAGGGLSLLIIGALVVIFVLILGDSIHKTLRWFQKRKENKARMLELSGKSSVVLRGEKKETR